MSDSRVSRLGQIRIYTGKCFRIFFYEKGWKVILFAAVIAGMITYVLSDHIFEINDDTKTGCFAIVCACIWIGIFNSIQSICREREIIKREHRTGLHISSYIIAHMIYEMAVCLVQAVIVIGILSAFVELPEEGMFFDLRLEYFVSIFLIIYASDVLGIAVSSIVKTETAAMTVMPFVLILQLVFSGAIFPLEGLSNPLSCLTLSRWGMAAMGTSVDLNMLPTNITLQKFEWSTSPDYVGDTYDSVYDVVKEQEYEMDFEFYPGHLVNIWLVLIGYTALYGAVSIIGLEFVDKDKR